MQESTAATWGATGLCALPYTFLDFITDLVQDQAEGIQAALYADVLVPWCKEEYATTVMYRMQLAVDKLRAWAENWCVSINKNKYSTTLLTLLKQTAGTIKSGNKHPYRVMTRQPTLLSLLARNRLRNPKLVAKGRQQDNSVIFQEKKTLIRAALGQRIERDDFHFLDRW